MTADADSHSRRPPKTAYRVEGISILGGMGLCSDEPGEPGGAGREGVRVSPKQRDHRLQTQASSASPKA
jgi:hypothetical protein